MPVNIQPTAFVTDTGEWSKQADIVTFNHRALTAHQWAVLSELPEYERIGYVLAILRSEDLRYWEETE